jgi:hypothetical protein
MVHEASPRADAANMHSGWDAGLSDSACVHASLRPIFCANYSTHHAGQISAQVIENKGQQHLLSDTHFEGRNSLLRYHGAGNSPAGCRKTGSEN